MIHVYTELYEVYIKRKGTLFYIVQAMSIRRKKNLIIMIENNLNSTPFQNVFVVCIYRIDGSRRNCNL